MCNENLSEEEEMVTGSTRLTTGRRVREVFEDSPASPESASHTSDEEDIPRPPPTPERPPEPEGPPPADGEEEVIDRAAASLRSLPAAATGSTNTSTRSTAPLIYGYGVTPADPRAPTRLFNLQPGALPQTAVLPVRRAATSTRDAPMQGLWHTPTALDTQILDGGDLTRRSSREENVLYGIDDVEPAGLAYPYARRYARGVLDVLPHALYEILELPQRGLHRYQATGEEEYALHPLLLSTLVNADWRMRGAFDWPTEAPVVPTAVPYRNIDSVMHNASDARLSIAPMFRPAAPNIEAAALNRWLPVQRGLLLSLEELVRHALHTHSATLHAWELLHVIDGRPSDSPQVMSALDLLVAQQTNVLVELLHHVVYAHRHAYVRVSPAWLRNHVLGQPIFGQRRLFTVPTSLPA